MGVLSKKVAILFLAHDGVTNPELWERWRRLKPVRALSLGASRLKRFGFTLIRPWLVYVHRHTMDASSCSSSIRLVPRLCVLPSFFPKREPRVLPTCPSTARVAQLICSTKTLNNGLVAVRRS
jgi:hypothetical protein